MVFVAMIARVAKRRGRAGPTGGSLVRGVYAPALLLLLVFLLVISPGIGADDRLAPACPDGVEQPLDAGQPKSDSMPRWFVVAGIVNTYPQLESEHLINTYLEPFLRAIAPGFGDIRSISDLRDQHFLWPPHVGVGYVLSPKWAVFFQAGYAAGKVRTKSNDPSIFILALHTDVEIQRGAVYFGLCADYFPWGMPGGGPYHGVIARLRAARPVLGLRVVETCATYRAKAKIGLKPFPNLVNIELSDRWWVPSVNANVGVDIPITRRNTLSLNAGYNFALDRPYDFEGAAFTVAWKHFFH